MLLHPPLIPYIWKPKTITRCFLAAAAAAANADEADPCVVVVYS